MRACRRSARLCFSLVLLSCSFLAIGCGEVVSKSDPDASSGDAMIPDTCGNGQLDPGEQCDGPVGPNTICDQCILVCTDSFANCPGDPGEACLTDLANDPANCGACGQACADSNSCVNGTCQEPESKLVFLSSWVLYGDFGGVFAADDLCQSMASDAGHDGEFRAWLSSEEVSVIERFSPSDGPYTLIDGTRIADNWSDLTDGELLNPIFLNEFGEKPQVWGKGECHGGETCTQAFTATDANGRYTSGKHADCGGWSHRERLPGFTGGTATLNDESWTVRASGFRCDYAARLYCFEQ